MRERLLARRLRIAALVYLMLALAVMAAREVLVALRDGFIVSSYGAVGPRTVVVYLAILIPGMVLFGLAGLVRRRWLAIEYGALSRPRPQLCIAGCVLFSLGVKLFLDAGMGTDPFHAMTVGIAALIDHPAVGIGVVDAAATAALLAVWTLWNRKLPPIGTFISMALIGLLIDGWNLLGIERWTIPVLPEALMMAVGLVLVAYGSALIIMAGVGIRVVDLVALAFVRHLGWRFYLAKLLLEAGFLAIGWLAGGPIGIATIAFVLVVGPFVEPMIWANTRWLRLPDHGLRPDVRPALPIGPASGVIGERGLS